jgi:hypothetical protein
VCVVGVWGCGGVGGVGGVVGVVWVVCVVCVGGVGVVSPCVRTFQGLHSVRLWTPTILNYLQEMCLNNLKRRFLKILFCVKSIPCSVCFQLNNSQLSGLNSMSYDYL